MTKIAVVAAAIALGLSLPAFADNAFDVADQVCGAWLASGPITECSYGYDRGHYHIDATINLDGYEAWRVCPQFAAGIAATTPAFNGQLWKLRLFSPYGEPIAYCGLLTGTVHRPTGDLRVARSTFAT
jgi:hypothetical protein